MVKHVSSPDADCSERWIRGVDQGWIGVDRGGSGVDHGHILLPSLRETLGNVGEQRKAADLAAGRTCAFIKLKEEDEVSIARQILERREGGRAVAVLEFYGPWFCSLRPDVLHRTDHTEPNQPT